MTRDKLIEVIRANTRTFYEGNVIIAAVDAYSSASNDGKPLVSGSLPPTLDEFAAWYDKKYDFKKFKPVGDTMAELVALFRRQ